MLPCTMPWVWYKFSKVLNLPKMAKTVLFVAIVFVILQLWGSTVDGFKVQSNINFGSAAISWISFLIFVVAIVFLTLLTIVWSSFNKKYQPGKESNCCEHGCANCEVACGCVSCLEIWFCTVCVAGQMGKELETNGLDV